MRDLNEYKAEIFRRSEEKIVKRIEKRRKTKKIFFSLCVPLCLAVTIGSVTLFSVLNSREEENIRAVEENLYETAVEKDSVDNEITGYISADISFGADECVINRINDTKKIYELSETINSAYADSFLYYDITERGNDDDAGDNLQNDAEMYDGAQEHIIESEDQPERYKITLTASDGYKKIIVIEGNRISDPELNIDVVLKEQRLSELKKFLGSNN